jgi:hypothetical protein
VLLTALQTAVGRLDLGIEQALSPRYAYSSFTFWLALVVGFLTPLRERFPRFAPAYLAAAALVAVVVGVTSLPSRTSLRTDVFGKEAAVLAYLAGVDDPSGTLTGGATPAVVRDAFRWMEEGGLGPWAPGGVVDDMQFELAPAPVSEPCAGAIEHQEPVAGGTRLTGSIAAPAGESASRNLAVVNGEGEPQGRGRVGVGASFVAYARADPAGPLAVVLIGDDGRTAVCRLDP